MSDRESLHVRLLVPVHQDAGLLRLVVVLQVKVAGSHVQFTNPIEPPRLHLCPVGVPLAPPPPPAPSMLPGMLGAFALA